MMIDLGGGCYDHMRFLPNAFLMVWVSDVAQPFGLHLETNILMALKLRLSTIIYFLSNRSYPQSLSKWDVIVGSILLLN